MTSWSRIGGAALGAAAMVLAALTGGPGASAAGPGGAAKTQAKAQAKAKRAGSPHGSAIGDMDCSACHTTDDWSLDDGAAAGGGFDHAATGFPLVGQHRSTPCSGCHDAGLDLSQACDGCHRDPHARKLRDSCAECHTASAWSDTATLARHRRSRMPLTGRHAIIECAACHRRQDARSFASTPSDCFACHAADYRRDMHPDHDGDPDDPGQAAFPRQCGRCHTTAAWLPAIIVPGQVAARLTAPAGHDARFLLSRGAHRGAACDSCHVSAARPRLVTCAGCHSRAALAPRHRRARLDLSPAACLRCHPGGRAR